jgi:hypothetical protein
MSLPTRVASFIFLSQHPASYFSQHVVADLSGSGCNVLKAEVRMKNYINKKEGVGITKCGGALGP